MVQKKKNKLFPIVPIYAIVPLLSCIFLNFFIYGNVDKLTVFRKHYDFTLAIDRHVPVIPWFVSIYIGCYLFWIVNYIIIVRQSKEFCIRFIMADMMSRIICAFFYLVIPTTNVRPELTGSNIWVTLLNQVYLLDAPTKLFPSIHCLVSWFAFIGIRGRKNIPIFYRVFSCFFALLVCVSTQVTKQHYIVDVIGGIAVAELTFYITFHSNYYKKLSLFFDKITSIFFHGSKQPNEEGV